MGAALLYLLLTTIVLAVVITVAVSAFVPFMVMVHIALVPGPAAFVKAFPIVVWFHPVSAFIGRAGPISVVPFVLITVRKPISAQPDVACARASGLNSDHSRRWRGSNPDANRDLRKHRCRAQ